MIQLLPTNSLAPALMLPALVATWLTAVLLRHFKKIRPVDSNEKKYSHFPAIDGLRGLLALGVMLHHATIWYFYLRTGRWEAPPSRLHNQLGQVGVAMFFMITAFLFHLKLLKSHSSAEQSLNWHRLYLSRILRLVPLYLATLVAMLLLVGERTGWKLLTSWPELLQSILAWLMFTVPGNPNINTLQQTFVLTAGVTWSLPYEWLWYGLLPLMAWLVGLRPARSWLLFGWAVLLSTIIWHPRSQPLLGFAGGITAAWLVHRYPPAESSGWSRFASSSQGSTLALICLMAALNLFESAYRIGPLLLLTLAFSLICNGSTLYGLLTHSISRWLGDRAYGLYLLHGLLMSFLFVDLIGRDAASALSPSAHWACIAVLAPVLVLCADLSWRIIESPAIALLKRHRTEPHRGGYQEP
jgi:peptidoglycan/LPS O-acetylase OafA/YrhL